MKPTIFLGENFFPIIRFGIWPLFVTKNCNITIFRFLQKIEKKNVIFNVGRYMMIECDNQWKNANKVSSKIYKNILIQFWYFFAT